MVRALRAEIFKYKGNDCSNGGISSRFNDVYIICDEGNYKFDENELPDNLVVLVKRELWGENHWYIKPYKDTPKGNVGYMYGGCIVSSSDSRFRRLCGDYPLPLHDRTETQEQYDILSF